MQSTINGICIDQVACKYEHDLWFTQPTKTTNWFSLLKVQGVWLFLLWNGIDLIVLRVIWSSHLTNYPHDRMGYPMRSRTRWFGLFKWHLFVLLLFLMISVELIKFCVQPVDNKLNVWMLLQWNWIVVVQEGNVSLS